MGNNEKKPFTRRSFVKNAAVLGPAVAISGNAMASAIGSIVPDTHTADSRAGYPQGEPSKRMIGLQTGVSAFAGDKTKSFLDDIQQGVSVNTLFPFMFTYIASRVGPDIKNFHGGNYATTHPQYYKDVHLKMNALKAPEYGGVDLLAKLLDETKRRQMKVLPYILEDNKRPLYIEEMDQLYEIDLYGRRAPRHPAGPCYNNPYYQNLTLGLVEDYCRSYPIDGIMWGAERQGPMNNALGAYHHGARSDPGRVTCFCPYCTEKAKRRGIDVERVKQGFRELERFVNDGRSKKRPVNGYYVTFWNLLINHPEILVWESFWAENLRDFQRAIYEKIKSINPALLVGFHLWHNISFNPIYRAEQDYRQYVDFADFIEPVLYNHTAGERMASYIDSVCQNLYGDFSKEQATEFSYQVLNYKEKPYDELRDAGLSGDYVFRETKRAKDSLDGTSVQVWPGVGIDVPSPTPSTSEIVRNAVSGAIRGGADGILLSRKFDEMRPEHLRSAGEVLKKNNF